MGPSDLLLERRRIYWWCCRAALCVSMTCHLCMRITVTIENTLKQRMQVLIEIVRSSKSALHGLVHVGSHPPFPE